MKRQVRETIWAKYGGHCAYCGKEITIHQMQVDHIFPKNRGGQDEIDNYNPSCRSCNFYKSDHTIEEFREQMASLHERIVKPFIVRLGISYGIVHMEEWDKKFFFEHTQSR